jgi:hypothetical protein
MAVRQTQVHVVSLLAAAAIALAMALPAGARSDVKRCEDGTGRITYSNESCPTGTTRERIVEDRPAVEVPRDDTGAKPVKSARTSNVVPSPGDPETRNPERAQEVVREQRKAQIARCDDLVHRIEFAQQDLQSAGASERASMELGLRRLQEEHAADCTPAGAPAPR